MHHRQPETKEKRSILVGKPAGNDIPTLECVVASLTLARELLMHHKHLERGRARTRRGCLTKSHLRHSTRCSSVLGERLAHTTVSFPTFEEPATGTARGRRGVLSHEVSPPTQRTVLECIGRTVRPCSTASFEEPATGTERERGGVVPRSLFSDTAHGTRVYRENRSVMLHCLFRRACHRDGARARRGCLTRSHLRHSASLGGNAPVMLHSLSRRACHWDGVRARSYLTRSHLQHSARYSSVLGDHAPRERLRDSIEN